MKLKDYIKGLNEFVKENPEALELEVVTSCDDEGNSYNTVYYSPSVGIYEDREFIPLESYEDYEREEDETNAVCVN